MPDSSKTVVIISANIEWAAIRKIFAETNLQTSPYGQWFSTNVEIQEKTETVIFFTAAGAKFQRQLLPNMLLINGLPTCLST